MLAHECVLHHSTVNANHQEVAAARRLDEAGPGESVASASTKRLWGLLGVATRDVRRGMAEVAAARGRTPEEFFEGPDRLASLREGGSPARPWWKQEGEPVDVVAGAAPDVTDTAAGEDPRLSPEATRPIDD